MARENCRGAESKMGEVEEVADPPWATSRQAGQSKTSRLDRQVYDPQWKMQRGNGRFFFR